MAVETAELKKSEILADVIQSLPQLRLHHARGGRVYNMLKRIARQEVESLLMSEPSEAVDFQPFGELVFPYFKMGAADSLRGMPTSHKEGSLFLTCKEGMPWGQ